MKILKYVGFSLLAVIFVVLVVAIFVPKTFMYEKSIAINAPIDSVWSNTNSLTALDSWSPWNDLDPKMKKETTGENGTVGSKQSWESEIVGSGSQTITTIQPPVMIETDLEFVKPQKSQGKAYIKLLTDGTRTNATWGMTGSIPYPMNIMILFMNLEKDMGKDWERGLYHLKTLSENKSK